MDIAVVSLAIFFLTYLLIAARRLRLLHIGRPAGALVGAVAMVLFGVMSVERAYGSIDMNTVTLLFGMMVISEYLRVSGFFRGFTALVLQKVSSPGKFLTAVVWVSGIGSAFLVNDPVCIMMTPIVLAYAVSAEVDPLPFLIALATSSNIGSMATLAGNPQNMLIASVSGLSYSKYALAVFPLSIVLLYVNSVLLRKVFGASIEAKEGITPRVPDVRIKKTLLLKSAFVLSGVVTAWFMGAHLAFTAIAGCAVLILLARISPGRIFAGLDWSILIFFAALFVVVGGVENSGVLDGLIDGMPKVTGFGGVVVFSCISVVFSNLFSNVPFVMVAMKWASLSSEPHLFYYLLAVTSTLAGNLTLVGSMANLIVVELAKGSRVVGFREYFRYGLVITAITVTISVGYLYFLFRVIGFRP